jgi:transposase
MSYIIEQKIKGKIYLYKVESYWDKEKKQPLQKRVYIGPKDKSASSSIKSKPTKLISKNYGNVYLLNEVVKRIGLDSILKSSYPDLYREIIALAYYEIMESSPSYLFPYWLDEQDISQVKKLHSPDISEIYDTLGRDQESRKNFHQRWIAHLKPSQGIYYDITSISSYSTKIDYIEWGYNRDKESLPQANVGLVCCQKSSLPFFYNILPGSIVDVSTILNFLKYLKAYDLQNALLIMDRGFFSTGNILELNKNADSIKFIQPIPFSLKKAKELIKKHKHELSDISTAFNYNQEIIHHVKTSIGFGQATFDAHIYLNEKAELEQRHIFLSKLLEIEQKHKDNQFKTLQEAETFIQLEIKEKFRDYFKWNNIKLHIEKDVQKVDEHLSKLGYFILITNKFGQEQSEVLDHYRNKDKVEKMFDVMKNELDGSRLRVHSQFNADGKIFVKFISLILYMEISRIMKENKLFDKYSMKELLWELKKTKITYIDANDPFISEISKKQKLIFKAFNISLP